jgi:hypothetical protein
LVRWLLSCSARSASRSRRRSATTVGVTDSADVTRSKLRVSSITISSARSASPWRFDFASCTICDRSSML